MICRGGVFLRGWRMEVRGSRYRRSIVPLRMRRVGDRDRHAEDIADNGRSIILVDTTLFCMSMATKRPP